MLANKILNTERGLLNLTNTDAGNTDWVSFYHKNSLSPEFVEYNDYYIQTLKNYKKILIIEDDPISFKVIQSYVKDFDDCVQCFYASNEKDALDIVRIHKCDLVISDFFLEGEQNGLEICNKIKNEFPEIEFSIISSLKHHQFQEIIKYFKEIPTFFEKPVSKNKMIGFLKEVYGGHYA